MGGDTPPPQPPLPKKSAAGRLENNVSSAAKSPKILLLVLCILAMILLRDYLEVPVAGYIAGIVTTEENFKPDDDKKARANRLDAYILYSLLSSENQELRTRVSLYGVQMLLMDPAFYGNAKAQWAVKIAGHTQFGMVTRGLPRGQIGIGTLDAIIATALIITSHTTAD